MPRLVYVLGMIALVSTAVAGCQNTQSDASAGAGSAQSAAAPARTAAAGPRGVAQGRLNCELKNGPTGCVDEQAQLVEARRARERANAEQKMPEGSTPRTVESEFQPWMCKQGGGGFFGFWGGVFTARLDKLIAYCERIDREADGSGAVAASSGGIDKSGTWQCQLANGMGPIYGTYQATTNPRVIASTCKRVGD
jgi:hypothetical protein